MILYYYSLFDVHIVDTSLGREREKDNTYTYLDTIECNRLYLLFTGLFSELGQTVVVARFDNPRAPMLKHPIKRCHLKKGVLRTDHTSIMSLIVRPNCQNRDGLYAPRRIVLF